MDMGKKSQFFLWQQKPQWLMEWAALASTSIQAKTSNNKPVAFFDIRHPGTCFGQ